jgi:hypothetical protein
MPNQTVVRIKRGKPHASQVPIIKDARRFNVLVCGRRFGKTRLGIYMLAQRELYGLPCAWFAPAYKDILEVWREMNTTLKPIITRSSIQERRIELAGGGSIEFWSLDNEDAGRGRKYKRVIIDEAAKAPYLQAAWEQAIRPTLTDYKGDAFFLSTPKGRNYFWRLYQRALQGGEWQAWHYPTTANPFIDPTEVEAAKHDLPEAIFKQEYLAEFIENEGSVFRNIDACMNAVQGEHAGHNIVMGVDWGKQNDFTCISVGCADCRIEIAIDRFNQIDYVFQRARLTAMREKWRVGVILAESNSIGEPVIEVLQREGMPVRGFQTTAQSKPPLIENLALTFERTEWQFIPDAIWRGELEAYERTVSPVTGRSSYSAPDGTHDDTVIARALMVWQSRQGVVEMVDNFIYDYED